MTEPIRLLHFADIHIGMENYGRVDPVTGISSRVMDFLARMDEIVAYAAEQEADLVIFAGDAFKTANPNPTFQREFARRIKQIATCCPVVLLVGNHDIPNMTQKASSIEIFQTLEVENVIVGRTPAVHRIETRRGPVQVGTMPYPVKQRLLAELPTRGLNIEELDQMLREQVAILLANLAEQIDPAIPAVLTGHFTVQGAVLGSERSVMLGRDVAVLPGTLADPAWDYVALGHIHSYQDLNKGRYPAVVYSGSVERIDFGEESDPKGFCWVNLRRGETTYEFVELPVRPFLTIRVDVCGQPDPTAAILRAIERHSVDGSVVRMIITATPENENLIRDRDIEQALHRAAFVAAIRREVEHPVRSRLGVQRIEGLTPLELLEQYLLTKDTDPERIALLRQYADELLSGEPTQR